MGRRILFKDIKKTLECLEEDPVIFTFSDLVELAEIGKYNFKGKFVLFIKFILTKIFRKDRLKRDIKLRSSTSKFKKFFIFINEDACYAYYLPKYKESFIVGNLKDSMSFCIDCNVEKQLNKFHPHTLLVRMDGLTTLKILINGKNILKN